MTAPARRRDMRPDNVYVSRLLANVPQELRVQPVWVCWKWEAPVPRKRGTASAQRPTPAKPPKPAKLTKVLYDPHSGRRAKVNDASTWGAFDDALSSYQQGGYAGLGYVLSAGAGVAVIDLDGCRDSASGALAPWALALIERLASYTEISPSGTGVHIWLCATLPDKEHSRAGAIEIYSADRFMTVTGERLPNTPAGIEERGRQLADVYRETFAPKQQKRAPASPPAPRPDLAASDADILARARNDAKFQALWTGDASGYPSASEADMALVGRLRFYAQGDASMIDRLFRQSGLMREKWDTRHFASGETYGEHSIQEALSGPYEVWMPRHKRPTREARERQEARASLAQVAPAYAPVPDLAPIETRQDNQDAGEQISAGYRGHRGGGPGDDGGAGVERLPEIVELVPGKIWCNRERTEVYRASRSGEIEPVRLTAGVPRLLGPVSMVDGEIDGDASEATFYTVQWSNLPQYAPVTMTEKRLNAGEIWAKMPGVTITARRDKDFWADVVKGQALAFKIPVCIAQQATGWHQNGVSGLWEHHLRDGRNVQRPDAPAVPIAGVDFTGPHADAWKTCMPDLPNVAPGAAELRTLLDFVGNADPCGRLLINMGAAMRSKIASFAPVATAVIPVGQSRAGKTISIDFSRGTDGPCPPRARADCVFTGTLAGLTSAIEALHDVYILIDDFHIMASSSDADRAKLANQLDMLITGGADGNDIRPRATRSGKRRKETLVQAMLALTGEGLPATTESRILRAIILPYQRGEMDTSALLAGWQEHQRIWWHAGHAVMRWVGEQVNEDTAAFRHDVERQEAAYKAHILAHLQEQCPTIDREALDTLANGYARPALGLWLVTRACGLLSSEEGQPGEQIGAVGADVDMIAAVMPALLAYAVKQARSIEMGGPGQASRQWIVDTVRAIIAEGRGHGLDMLNGSIAQEQVAGSLSDYGYQGPFPRGEHLFNRDSASGMTYWRTDRLCAALADRASRARPQSIPWPWNAQTLPGYLVKLGIVAPEIDESGAVKRAARRCYVGNKLVRRLAIPESLFIGEEDTGEEDISPSPDDTPPSPIGDMKNSGHSGHSGHNDASGPLNTGLPDMTAHDRSQNDSGHSGHIRLPADGMPDGLICPMCGDCQYYDYGDGARCPICDVPMIGASATGNSTDARAAYAPDTREMIGASDVDVSPQQIGANVSPDLAREGSEERIRREI